MCINAARFCAIPELAEAGYCTDPKVDIQKVRIHQSQPIMARATSRRMRSSQSGQHVLFECHDVVLGAYTVVSLVLLEAGRREGWR